MDNETLIKVIENVSAEHYAITMYKAGRFEDAKKLLHTCAMGKNVTLAIQLLKDIEEHYQLTIDSQSRYAKFSSWKASRLVQLSESLFKF